MLMLGVVTLALCVVLGIALDLVLGEARRWHPLAGFGLLASMIERHWNGPQATRLTGALAWKLVVLPIVVLVQVLLVWSAHVSLWLAPLLHALLLYFCLGLRSLYDHSAPIQAALQQGDLDQARELTACIVSRDTAESDEAALSKASVESVLENGCDAVFGTLFWFVLLGGAGALLYRLSNTLDAMWGYRTPRLHRFGCVAARVDDALNWVPARLTALTYAALGNTGLAWQCWRKQAPSWPSPNAGPVMAAGAGALELALGGVASYHGVSELRPPLGEGKEASAADITRAWQLVLSGTLLWLGVIAVAAIFMSGILYA